MKHHPGKIRKPNLISISTINDDGSHHVLHPADVSGKFTSARRLFAVFLIVIYMGLPWIPVNEAPAVFFDVEMRRFHIMGLTLMSQDLWVMFFGISGLGFLLFVITSLLGRLWCGWACPYTVFLDHVFRRIERWIDGDAPARRRLSAAPNDFGKITRRLVKHALYLLVSALVAHVFLSYFVSISRLYTFIGDGPFRHLTAFSIVGSLTAALYFCFAKFREQFCVLMCPYGRLQSVLTDDETIIIGYDENRGEPRGRATNPNAGSCVDCFRCVKVCPTGIDIRNGLQMECIGCAACIDACDDIMLKLKRPKGLIRYDSMSGLAGKKRRVLRPRLYAYFLLGLLGVAALGITAYFRAKPVNAEISRMRGPSFFSDAAAIRNHYQLRLMNKRNQTMAFEISLENPPPGFQITGISGQREIMALDDLTSPVVVIVSREDYKGPCSLTLRITAQPGDVTVRQKIEFLGPNPRFIPKP